jgi:GH15 family glucan-1,4-alpha-glucosidase
MPILGFLPATDERMRSTIEAIAADLTEDMLVLRYRNEEGLNADGLTGEEGTFVICSFWLVSALAKAGEVDRAEQLFDQLASYANDLGLSSPPTRTTSAFWPRRSTRRTANCSETSRRRSATSA